MAHDSKLQTPGDAKVQLIRALDAFAKASVDEYKAGKVFQDASLKKIDCKNKLVEMLGEGELPPEMEPVDVDQSK